MVYNYTKPRGPIAAMYSSPGPCYALPNLLGHTNHDPRSNHFRSSQWSFGVKHGETNSENSPGPCYLPDSKFYRDGKDSTPHYSISGRYKEPMIYSNPGPGAYCINSGNNNIYSKPPAYSISSRHKEFKTDNVPGAGTYKITNINIYKESPPNYTLLGRTSLPIDNTRKPGPGAYCPENVTYNKHTEPQFSFGIRHSQYKGEFMDNINIE